MDRSHSALSLSLLAVVVAAMLSLPRRADADEPFRQVDRPLTHAQGTLNLYAGLDIYRLYAPVGLRLSRGDTAVGLHAGVELGIVDDFTLGALIFPLQLSPETQYGDASLYGLYRFLRGSVEIAGAFGLTLPSLPNSDPVLTVGLPIRVHASHRVRFDTGPSMAFAFGDETHASLFIPFALSINPGERFLFGMDTGLSFPDMDFDLTTVPLGLAFGYTVGRPEGAFADLWVHFEWPALWTPGLDDTFHADIWQLSFLVDAYFDLDF